VKSDFDIYHAAKRYLSGAVDAAALEAVANDGDWVENPDGLSVALMLCFWDRPYGPAQTLQEDVAEQLGEYERDHPGFAAGYEAGMRVGRDGFVGVV
jgi:hypothetical protein